MSKRIFSGVVSAVLLAAVVMAFLQRQAIADWVRLYNYDPSSEIVALADNTSMNSGTRRLFYVNHPDIADKAEFNTHCRSNEQTIVLGCFIENKGIYILHISDERLRGIQEVTAAHETLHAAYARLSNKERQRVDAMTSAAFKLLSDNRIKNTIELYRKQDARIVPNELHSILGTEARNLPADLEAYYSQYFTNRLRIVAYSEQYEQVFTDQRNQIADYDAQLASLKNQIDTLRADLQNQEAALVSERQTLNALKNSGRYSEYNAAVPGYNDKVNTYNRDIDRLSSLITQFNDIVPKRNAVASEESDLVKAIDSRDIPQQQ
jgi:hypothetical protein